MGCWGKKDSGFHCVLIRAEVVQQESTHKGEHKNGRSLFLKPYGNSKRNCRELFLK